MPAALGLALAFAAFVSLGLPDGLLGVAWPSIRAEFGLAQGALGPLLVATTTGYVAASFASGALLGRMRVAMLLALSCAATAVSLAGYAAAPAWSVVVAFGLLAGAGAGAIDAGLNTWVATRHSARTLNWLHACYGVGAALGPAIMTGVLVRGDPWQRGYADVAIAQLALAALFVATRGLWGDAQRGVNPANGVHEPPAAAAATLRHGGAWAGMACFFLYVGLEQSAGAWAFSFLTEARGVPVAAAGASVSAFWGALTAGRVAFGLVANRVPAAPLVRGAIAGISIAAMLVAIDPFPGASAAGLALLGFACGPVFPSLIAATPHRIGAAHAANAVGFQIAAAALGQALVPWLVGAAAQRTGLAVLGRVLVALAIALAIVHERLARSRPHGDARIG